MDQWLVRTAQNRITGPFPKEKILKLISSGELSLQDEICPANGYWFFLHEKHEMQQFLGIQLPRVAAKSDDEITQTETLLDDGKTDPNFSPKTMAGGSRSSSSRKPKERSSQEIIREMERYAFWRGFAWVLVVLAGFLFVAIVRLLKSP